MKLIVGDNMNKNELVVSTLLFELLGDTLNYYIDNLTDLVTIVSYHTLRSQVKVYYVSEGIDVAYGGALTNDIYGRGGGILYPRGI
ncbi:hypothetical protein ACQ3G4_16780 [bacterium BS0013]